MPRTPQAAPSAPAYSSLSIDAETLSNLHDLLDQRKKLDDAVSTAPAEIGAAEAELSALRQQMATLEADIILIDDAQLAQSQKRIQAMDGVIAQKEIGLRRAKARLEALEARAPDLDEKIEIAIGYVRIEANIAAGSLRAELAEELRTKVRDLQLIYAKVRALNGLVRTERTSDFLMSALIPDLDHSLRVTTKAGTFEQSTNLLEVKSDDTSAAAAVISEALRPLTEVLLLAKKHRPYVPLAKRPTPYVRKGAWDGPGGRVDRPEEPEVPPAPMKTIEEALAEPYEIKGDSTGIRTWKQAAEMNMTAAIIQAAESADR